MLASSADSYSHINLYPTGFLLLARSPNFKLNDEISRTHTEYWAPQKLQFGLQVYNSAIVVVKLLLIALCIFNSPIVSSPTHSLISHTSRIFT